MSGDDIITWESGTEYQIIELNFSPDGEMLIWHTDTGQLSVWLTIQGTDLFGFEYDLGNMVDVRYILDNKALAILNGNGKLSIYAIGEEEQ